MNIFLHSPLVAWVASVCGVIVFVGLTAYDTPKIKALGAAGFADESTQRKSSILGELTHYPDFINLFLMLLNLFGRRR